MKTRFKLFGISILMLNLIYLIWLSQNMIGIFGIMLFASEAMFGSLGLLFLINHWRQDNFRHAQLKHDLSLDVFITVVDEPIELFKETLVAAANIDYKNKELYVLDDGRRDKVQHLAEKYGAHYIARKDRTHYKAGNLNNALKQSVGEFLLILDADQVVKPVIAQRVLGHFDHDPKLAIVTTRQSFRVPEKNFNHDPLFYEHMQNGKNSDNSSISTGSGVFYRRSCIEDIGGFQTWNIVEDLYTSFVLHTRGYRTRYINTVYSEGTAPTDIPTIYKQRGTWATDTMRLFFKKNILFEKRLTFKQKLHYFESAWVYIVSALALSTIFLLPSVSLLTNQPLIGHPEEYALFRLPSLIGVILFYFILSAGSFSTSQYWASLFPVYFKAMILAIGPGKPKYKVTNKNPGHSIIKNLRLISVQLTFLAIGFTAEIIRIFVYDHRLTTFSLVNLVWISVMIFWFGPIIKSAFRPVVLKEKSKTA